MELPTKAQRHTLFQNHFLKFHLLFAFHARDCLRYARERGPGYALLQARQYGREAREYWALHLAMMKAGGEL